MLKSKRYPGTRFRSHVFAEADQAIGIVIPSDTRLPQSTRHKVFAGDEFYRFDTVSDFLIDVERGPSLYHRDCGHRWGLEVFTSNTSVRVDVWAPTRSEINSVFTVFDKYAPESKLAETLLKNRPMIFIGHGPDPQWRDLKDELQGQHEYEVVGYQIGKGDEIRNVLREVLQERSFALLVMAADDGMREGKLRARQDLIYETGLFVGKLGFGRAMVLLEEGNEEFSDINGVYQVRFAQGRVREAVGDVLAVVKREFEA